MLPKILYWKYKPEGVCPVQAEGYFLGTYFYFRSRWQTAKIAFYNTDDIDDEEIIKEYKLYKTEPFEAGWLDHRLCTFLIYVGCFLFWMRIGVKKSRIKNAGHKSKEQRKKIAEGESEE
jgi:hypothetical protein